MPDEWERLNGLDPNNAEDGSTYTLDPKGFYTNVEVYINQLVEDIMKNGNANAESTVDEYYPTAAKSGVTQIEGNQSEVVAVEYYNLSGMRLSEPDEGITIRRIIFADGTSETDKVIKR